MMNDIMLSIKKEVDKNTRNSSFDFESFEVNEIDIATVCEQEKIFFNSFRKYRNNLYSLCESLAAIESALKPTNSFMAWYESAGLSKDMVSVLLKRWNLYQQFLDYKEKIFAFSDQAVKILTHKDVTYDDALAILSDDITRASDIKALLAPAVEQIKMEFRPEGQKFFNFKKINKMKKRMNSLSENDAAEFKKELKEYISQLENLLREE